MKKIPENDLTAGYEYVERKARIKYLSAPMPHKGETPEAYYKQLLNNFLQIRELAEQNRALLKTVLYPVLDDKESCLKQHQIESIKGLIEKLLNSYSMDNLDAGMAARAADRLLLDAEHKSDVAYLIEELHMQVHVYYTLMNMCERLQQFSDLREKYRQKGLNAAKRLYEYLDKDNFVTLPNELCRKKVLEISRFITALFEDKMPGNGSGRLTLQFVAKALEIAEDEFYNKEAPEYDWKYHIVRCYEYAGLSTECGNGAYMSRDDTLIICDYMKKLKVLLETEEARKRFCVDKIQLNMMECRAQFYAGLIDRKSYIRKLVELYHLRDENCYDTRAEYGNLVLPIEYIIQLDPKHLTRMERDNLEYLYQSIAGYAVRIPNGGSLSYMLEYFSYFLEHFIELSGGTTFKTMCLNCLAALHPPTFVHSVMVGEIAKCLCHYLVQGRPELFYRLTNCKTHQEVLEQEENLLDFVFDAGCCHDVGKLIYIDTIFIYGRELSENEFHIVREHPDAGAYLLIRNPSTTEFTNIARGHHRWYDDSKGYPENYNTAQLREKVIIDLIACADCLDAATDTIGRSYSQGISLEQFIAEVDQGAGTRYAPYVAELLHQEPVQEDIRNLLKEGRKQKYYSTYSVLQKILQYD